MSLAIRIKGKILLTWLTLLYHYSFRPRYYIFSKNDAYLRDTEPYIDQVVEVKAVKKKKAAKEHMPLIPIPELVRIEEALADMRSNFHITTNRKGELDVRITEIK